MTECDSGLLSPDRLGVTKNSNHFRHVNIANFVNHIQDGNDAFYREFLRI